MRKLLLSACLALAAGVVQPASPALVAEAEASVAVAYTLEELVDSAPVAVVARAVERKSQWEEVGGSRRIVTYTQLAIESRVYGASDSEIWVRTLGGVVGKVGQQVSGEASFTLGERSLVFLDATPRGITVVAGAAQGQFLVEEPDQKRKVAVLRASPNLGTVVDRAGPRVTVRERLVDKPLSEAVSIVREVKAARDAKK